MSNQISRTQISVLRTLAETATPLTREELETSNRTLGTLEEAALISSETRGEGEEVRTLYSITEAGHAAIAKPEKPAKPELTISKTLMRCLGILENGEWHTASELNTSHQNHQRLVDGGFTKMKMEDDGGKVFQVTKKGLKELELNRKLMEDTK